MTFRHFDNTDPTESYGTEF
ncbi:hypothetical protein JL09_g5980 [Pichia kudriavzevii]|uniref:Uncharacterized protein n=1 Tax=Pichia kudriavzevii TaxID=4909 RepID=A0A099NKL9_PICKU|nr:hypothetical protein JL09_g6946 [Pichia kudriavzevii]KGK34871.1 hypothetical protein JL09_g5980 [Pichia kudriavzevii]